MVLGSVLSFIQNRMLEISLNNQSTVDLAANKPKVTLPECLQKALPNAVREVAVSPPVRTTPAVWVPREVVNAPALDTQTHNGVASEFAAPDVASPDITNAKMIAAIFSTLHPEASPVVCTKPGDPTKGGWPSMEARQVDKQCLPSWNNYVNCSSFLADQYGAIHARKDSFSALHFILLDDMGTKGSWDGLNGFKPSFVIETSPGNYQAGIILATPVTNVEMATRLLNAVIAKGLSDPGATGVARWARLPVGINGKPKYKSESGQSFQCRVARWNPERSYTVDEIASGLDLDIAPLTELSAHTTSDADTSAPPARPIDPAAVARLAQLLDALDPDCGRPDWIRVLMAVYHTMGGSDEGLALVDTWSSKSKKYPGKREIEVQWRSFRLDVANPVTIGTLFMMASNAGADVSGLMKGCEHFEYCDTEVVEAKATLAVSTTPDNPLAKFSLLGQTQKLEAQMVAEKAILGQIALQGQATVIFAPPNMGKTAITIHLLREAINAGLLDPSMLYYINMDDNSTGLVAKNKLADEYGFNMLADGHKGFELADFVAAMQEMINSGSAKGVVIVLDTLKKFVNPMAKDQCRKFTRMARKFSMKGGTIIALAHVNKNRSASGKVVYAGTSDIIDDFDCAYTLDTVDGTADANTKVVEFSNSKRRGSVAMSAAYSYSVEEGLSYEDLILSIQELDAKQLQPLKQASEVLSDAAMIRAITQCISNGTNTKMMLADAAAEHVKASKRLALKVIEKYTGEDPACHRWKFVVRDRGAKVYELLQRPASVPVSAVAARNTEAITAFERAHIAPGLSDAAIKELCPNADFHSEILKESIEQYGVGNSAPDGDMTDLY